ncbi:hypothetical protein LUZ60_003352 [Juncus effusus]|nr:hypothetical protein LUZ60_003352 [Juncus effusus]
MAKSSADDMELKRQCQDAIDRGSVPGKQKVILCIRVAKTRAVWGKPTKLGRHMAKPRVLAISTKTKGQKTKAFLRVLKYSNGGFLEVAKIYKLKHLSKLEVVQNDPTGCTFTLGFDNLKNKSVAPPQWTMRNKDDRNRILMCILNLCKEVLGTIPKVQNIDIVEMALWAKENTPGISANQAPHQDGPIEETSNEVEIESREAVERDLASQAEEEDMEALFETYLMGIGGAEAFSERMKRELLALELANVHAILETEPIVDEVLQGLEGATFCMEDMDEWLASFNVKLRHMREDIESIENRNNRLEYQSENNEALIKELDGLLELLRIPIEYEEILTVGSFDEEKMSKNIEACEWLTRAIQNLELPKLDPCYVKMRAVREKRAEFILLRCTFVRRASEFLREYFPSVIDFMIQDRSNFSQKGQLKRPDHSDLRYKCRIYARLLQQIKSLDRTCLEPLRKAYCHSLNQLLRKEVNEFGNEVRASIKGGKRTGISFEGSLPVVKQTDTSAVSEGYSKMITAFIPLFVDESSFFTHFMCFEVSSGNNPKETAMLNECLQELLNGIKEEFVSVIDWAFKIDELSCISMHGITDRYLLGQKADNSAFVKILLGELETIISNYFTTVVDDLCFQIEKYEKAKVQFGVLTYITRFGQLAERMEQSMHGQSRDLIDQAYTKIVTIMFVTLENISQVDLKNADILKLENYAAFQNSLYELANVVPTLAKFYHQASESYEQACLKHINMVIYINFEKLFQFAEKLEELLFNNVPSEEIPFQVGMSKSELRKAFKYSLSGLDKTISSMYKKLQKNLTADELLPSLWDKCKKEFLDKYCSLLAMVQKIYPNETFFSAKEMHDLLANM